MLEIIKGRKKYFIVKFRISYEHKTMTKLKLKRYK